MSVIKQKRVQEAYKRSIENKEILYEKDGQFAIITFNRPEKSNAFGWGNWGHLMDCFDEAEGDDDVKVIIVQGAGRSFSGGHDLMEAVPDLVGWATPKPGEKVQRPSQRSRLICEKMEADTYHRVLYRLKPMVAKVHGYCVGYGAVWALFADVTIATEDAKIGFVEQRLGFGGVSVYAHSLAYAVGIKRARELILTGKIISGVETAQIGLVNKAVPADKLEEETRKMAKAIALMPADSLAIGMCFQNQIYDTMGLPAQFTYWSIGHALFTNMQLKPDEYNFYKERRNQGATQAMHAMHERYDGLV